MDLQPIGRFLAALRKERGLTQEQLAQQLGTSNKTISRWETGAYLPPVEMLQQLSTLYGLTINELLQGERIPLQEQPARAEETLTQILKESPFLFHEQKVFWHEKWNRDHRSSLLLLAVLLLGLHIAAAVMHIFWLTVAGALLTVVCVLYYSTSRAAYVERHLFDQPPQ